MSDSHEQHSEPAPQPNPEPALSPPYVIPVRYSATPGGPTPPTPPPPPRRPAWTILLILALVMSIGLNLLLLFAFQWFDFGDASSVNEHFYSGKASAQDKIAVIKLDGVIMESANGFVQKQIDQAASDPTVKAVVLRINSPGGTITGSDDLYRRLTELRDGKNHQQKGGKKTIVSSMAAMAASGGYYVAMPTDYIFAETTTITGSIGVYAAFPNVAGLGEKIGVGMNTIKAGDIKDAGSPFKKMTPQERQLWQDMVNQAYDRFTEVVSTGREGKLKIKPRDTVPWTAREIPNVDGSGEPASEGPKTVKFVRKVADGGIWTAKDALKLGLVDEVGYLDDAVKKTAELAKLTGPYKVVMYEKPTSLLSSLIGSKVGSDGSQLQIANFAAGAIPRLWYLAPQAELAGILAATGKD